MKQITLDLNSQQDYAKDNFITSLCNIDAYNAITKEVAWPKNQLMIIGEESSGKTHLANIWQTKNDAVFLKHNEDFNKYISLNSSYILEDIDLLKNDDYLFHLINHCINNSFTLLLTCKTLPNFKLIDLKSRINSMHKVLIKNPDDDLTKVLLLKHFSDRQLKVSQEILDYILTKTERSFSFISRLVNSIDKLSLEKRRNITIPIIREVFISNFEIIKE